MRKQLITNEDFIRLRQNAAGLSKSHVDSLVEKSVQRILRLKGPVAYSWSGGKDSVALDFVARKAGVTCCLFARCNLEYPAFEKWINKNKPLNLTTINTGQDIQWLSKHPEMLFPDGKHAGLWFSMVQHKAQDVYCQENHIATLLLGRRIEDGNYTGQQGHYVTKDRHKDSPLYEWTHQDIFALIDTYKLKLPPIYDWPNGYKCGTHAWPARQWCQTEDDGWKEVGTIDRSIVENVADVFPGARRFLKHGK